MLLSDLKILIAIEQNLFRKGLRELFIDSSGFPICNVIYCNNLNIAPSDISSPDVALIDLNNHKINGNESIKRILKALPQTRIVMLSLYVEPLIYAQIKDAGKRGVIDSESRIHKLIQSVTSLTSELGSINTRSYYSLDDTNVHLSKRELEVLRLIAEGKTGNEIADMLCVHFETIKGYRKSLIEKLKVCNTAELVAKSLRYGIIYTFWLNIQTFASI